VYEYQAVLLKVVDGDTVHARVDLGFDIRMDMKLRLMGINAPEMKTVQGLPAKDHLTQLLGPYGPLTGTPLTIRTEKDRQEKFGRYLATLILPGDVDLNRQMVIDGFAVDYNP